ncbi:MAG: DinB family protein, partial [bacterium]
MDLATYAVRQMEDVRSGLGGVLEGVTAAEWVSAPAPGQNPIGFTAWHLPSIQDWALHTWMRNIDPVRMRPEWVAKGMSQSFLPIGMGLDDAFAIARATRPEDVIAYADAVLDAAREFLATFKPDDFDRLPPNRDHLVDSRYNYPGYLD